MTTIDIRNQSVSTVDAIVFADETDGAGTYIGYKVARWPYDEDQLTIEDGTGANVVIVDTAHANNLIKALRKAIELGWLE